MLFLQLLSRAAMVTLNRTFSLSKRKSFSAVLPSWWYIFQVEE